MKKSGFTLAEILITLAIVGIVAALVIPALATKASRNTEASKLSSIVADLENAFSDIMTDTDTNDIFADGVLTSDNLREHLNYKTGGLLTSLGYAYFNPFDKIGGWKSNADKHDTCSAMTAYVLKNNAVICLCDDISTCSGGDICTVEKQGKRVIIDTNGAGSNNRSGRDVFDFALGTSGKLYPRGSQNYQYLMGSSEDAPECPGEGKGCAYRLVKNNYKVDY